MNPLLLAPIVDIGKTLIGKIFRDPAEKAKAELELLAMQQNGELNAMQVQLSAIIAEAQSQDKWTSRARPSFLYVIYFMVLASIPMGVLYAIQPETADSIATGMQKWLEAIPEEMWWLFGAGYLGYTGARSIDKRKK